jgi:serine/threonine-protein kinase HipA
VSALLQQRANIYLGRTAIEVGDLLFVRDGHREYSSFGYRENWLNDPERFAISPDLPLATGRVNRRAPTAEDSPFPLALADTEPDNWGLRIINRAHAKRRREDPSIRPLTRFDFLAAVDDESRVGALRLRDQNGEYLCSERRHRTPQLVDLSQIYASTRRVEEGNENEHDLSYLQGKATSLGGLRPKCTVRDHDGLLAIGKFPSISDTRSITRGEVLALKLAGLVGIDAAEGRVEVMEGTPIAIIRRFDRTIEGARIPYLSAGSLLQARRHEDRAYSEVVDQLRSIGAESTRDIRELWRRLLFNLLISNTDDHLWNLGLLHTARGLWRLAPAFDLNPLPDRVRESKTWLTEATGPITSLSMLLEESEYFALSRADAEAEAATMGKKIAQWREVATSKEVGLTERELEAFEPAFEHTDMTAARALAEDV